MADALLAIVTGEVEEGPRSPRSGPPWATIVVHATAQDLSTGKGTCEVEGGGVITAQAARRLGCSGRLQALLEDSSGTGIGNVRSPPAGRGGSPIPTTSPGGHGAGARTSRT